MCYILLSFLSILFLLMIYVVFGGPKLPEETNRIINEVSKSELSHIIKGETGYALSSNVKIWYDSRGTGLSDWMENWDSKNPYLLIDMANDAVAVLDELHIERVHIIGLSLGGMIAQEVAIAYPERIVSLTLLSTSSNVADTELKGMSMNKLLRTAISVLPAIKIPNYGW